MTESSEQPTQKTSLLARILGSALAPFVGWVVFVGLLVLRELLESHSYFDGRVALAGAAIGIPIAFCSWLFFFLPLFLFLPLRSMLWWWPILSSICAVSAAGMYVMFYVFKFKTFDPEFVFVAIFGGSGAATGLCAALIVALMRYAQRRKGT